MMISNIVTWNGISLVKEGKQDKDSYSKYAEHVCNHLGFILFIALHPIGYFYKNFLVLNKVDKIKEYVEFGVSQWGNCLVCILFLILFSFFGGLIVYTLTLLKPTSANAICLSPLNFSKQVTLFVCCFFKWEFNELGFFYLLVFLWNRSYSLSSHLHTALQFHIDKRTVFAYVSIYRQFQTSFMLILLRAVEQFGSLWCRARISTCTYIKSIQIIHFLEYVTTFIFHPLT